MLEKASIILFAIACLICSVTPLYASYKYASPPPAIPNTVGACVSFVPSPTTGKLSALYDHCAATPASYNVNGLIWTKYRSVTVDWITPPKEIKTYTLSTRSPFLETNRTGGSIIGDAATMSSSSKLTDSKHPLRDTTNH